jgi:amino acid permease
MIIIFGFPRFKLLHWTEPEQADRSFYEEAKEKLAAYPDLKFESEVNFWKSFWPYFIAILVFLGSAIWLFTIVYGKIEDNDILGSSLFLVCFSLYPAIYVKPSRKIGQLSFIQFCKFKLFNYEKKKLYRKQNPFDHQAV